MLRRHKKSKIEISKYTCSRLLSDHNHKALISTFSCSKNPSLAANLQRRAWFEEQNNKRAYFLIKEGTKIVLYFSLQCGILIQSHEKILRGIGHRETTTGFEYFINDDILDVTKTIPAIELSHLCINDSYRNKKNEWRIYNGPFKYRVGQFCFYQYIAPIVIDIATKLGVEIIYLFCADEGNGKLFEYYSLLNFKIMDNMACVRSEHEKNLLCMTQKISDLKISTDRFMDEKKATAILSYLKIHKNINIKNLKSMFEINDGIALLDKLMLQGLIEEDSEHNKSYRLRQK